MRHRGPALAAAAPTDKPDPRTPLKASHVHYVFARALHDGAVRLKYFEGSLCRSRHAPLPSDHHREGAPRDGGDSPDQWGSEVIVLTKDGRRLSRRVETG